MVIGQNPTLNGQGCLDGQDTSVTLSNSILKITTTYTSCSQQTPIQTFTAILYDEERNMVAGWNGTEWMSVDDMDV